MRKVKDWDFLYVPDDEVAQALFFGAVMLPGEARLAMPNPLPPGVEAKSFDRWRTRESMCRWCVRLVSGILGPNARFKKGEDPSYLPDMMGTLGREAGPADRIYLHVPMERAEAVRAMPGIHWDRRKRQYYATREADLQGLFAFMTPSAEHAWHAQRVGMKTTDWLMQEMAMAELKRRHPGAGGGGSAPQAVEAAKPSKAPSTGAEAQPAEKEVDPTAAWTSAPSEPEAG